MPCAAGDNTRRARWGVSVSERELSVEQGALATPAGAPEMESPAWLGNLPRILGDLGVGVVIWDDETPIYVSPLFSDMIGYTPDELGVRRPAHVSPTGVSPTGPGASPGGPAPNGIETSGDGHRVGAVPPQFKFKLMHEFEWVLIHKDGHRVHVEAAAGTIEVGGRVESIGIFCDRSEQERLQDELKTRTLQQAAVVDLGQRALAGGDLPDLMDQAVRVLANTLDVEFARVLELAADGRGFVVRAGVGWEGPPGSLATVDFRLRSQAGYTLVSDMPVVVEDFDCETRFPGPPGSRPRRARSGRCRNRSPTRGRAAGRPAPRACTRSCR